MTVFLALLLAAKPLVCPPGSLPAGKPPPFGNAEWCEGPDGSGAAKRQGPGRDYYELDLVHVEATWRNGQLDGPWVQFHRPWTYWFESGQVAEEVGFDMGKRHGRFVQWWPGGKKRTEGSFCFGLQCGRWVTWNEEGSELGTIVYEQIRAKP
jgi:antitoxin component YwqK of YwqJK toxin-antitoxin module